MPAKTKGKSQAPRAAALFEQARAKLDAKRSKQRQKHLWAHFWLLCPRCGGDMFVQRSLGVVYEVCRDCHNISIDGGEIELILEHLEAPQVLRAIIRKAKKPDTTEI
jgi:Zn-finger nucleic acid-binding protein